MAAVKLPKMLPSTEHGSRMNELTWHSAIRGYVLAIAGLNLLWEVVQLPLYTIWLSGSTQEIIVAVLHCTVGDAVIAISALTLALILLGTGHWPKQRYLAVGVVAVLFGLTYTIYSERINVTSGAWSYSGLMPIIPWLGVGLSPVLQWIVIPGFCFWKLRKPTN